MSLCKCFKDSIKLLISPYDSYFFFFFFQIVRSSRSVTANIDEGYGRYHFQENIQFCRIARGSLYETLDHLICALDENYISETEFSGYKTKYEDCLKILNGYILYLKKRKDAPNHGSESQANA